MRGKEVVNCLLVVMHNSTLFFSVYNRIGKDEANGSKATFTLTQKMKKKKEK